MINSKVRTILLIYVIYLSLVKSSEPVECDDHESYCPYNYVCCQVNSGGYSCCINTRYCCYGGSRCCLNQTDKKFLLNNWNTSIKTVEASKLKSNDDTQQGENESKFQTKEVSQEGIISFINGISKSLGLFESLQNILICKTYTKNFGETMFDFIENIYNLELKNFTSEQMSHSILKASKILESLNELIIQCEGIKKDLVNSQENIKNYFNREDLKNKLIRVLIRNEQNILKGIEKIKTNCYDKNYLMCGLSIGEVVSYIFHES